MRLRSALWLIFCAALACQAAEPLKLVVISIDGLDERYLKDADRLHLKIPVLRQMMARGGAADGVVGMPPTDGWPAMTTMVTGVAAARHGVMAGDHAEQSSKVQTLWQAALKAQKKTVLLNWPASSTDSGTFVCPPAWEKPGLSEVPFEPMAEKCTAGLVGRVASVYPRFTKSLWNDESAMMALDYLLQFEKPDLSLVQLTDLDNEERETGALSLYSLETLENDDELLGQMMTHLPARTVVAVVSGNGYETEEHVVRPRVMLKSPAVEVRYGLIGVKDQSAAAALRKLMLVKKNGLAREVPMAEVTQFAPELGGWHAAFATQPGFIAVDEAKGPAVGPGNHKGVHGLWPGRPGYRSVFLMSGEGVKASKLGEISILDVAPTLASVLGLSLPEAARASLWTKVSK